MSKFGDALGAHDRVHLEEHLEAISLEAVVWKVGAMGAETILIGKLMMLGMKRIEYNMVCQEMRPCQGHQQNVFWSLGASGSV